MQCAAHKPDMQSRYARQNGGVIGHVRLSVAVTKATDHAELQYLLARLKPSVCVHAAALSHSEASVIRIWTLSLLTQW